MAHMELVPSGYFFLRGEKKKKAKEIHSVAWIAMRQSISAVPNNFKGCLQTRQVAELLKKLQVFAVGSATSET